MENKKKTGLFWLNMSRMLEGLLVSDRVSVCALSLASTVELGFPVP